jgi:ribosomal protein S18 acetylase RimI-like enzyme
MTYEVREARPEEYDALGELAGAAYAALDGETDDGYLPEVRDVRGRAPHAPVLAAVDVHGTLVGTVTYVPGPENRYAEIARDGEAEFRMLAVAPAAQGRGIGRVLAEAVLARARAEGRAGVAIYTRPSMLAAHRLYASLGFERDAERDWEFEPGQWLWAYRLRFEGQSGRAADRFRR